MNKMLYSDTSSEVPSKSCWDYGSKLENPYSKLESSYGKLESPYSKLESTYSKEGRMLIPESSSQHSAQSS